MSQRTETFTFKEEQLRTWCMQVLKEGCGVKDDYAFAVTDALVEANMRGVDTHGINLLQYYVRRYRSNKAEGLLPRQILVTGDMPALCQIDGGGNMGPAVSVFAMNKAMEKAVVSGVGMALVENSSHYGAAGYYTCLAAKKGFIGFSTTTAYKVMTPWGGLENFLGNNPFSVAFPWKEFPIMLDISNSVTARNKVINYAREGLPLPEGWATDEEGNPTKDAQKALKGFLQPIAGYKGVGIALMIEIMLGSLTRGQFSRGIKPNSEPQGTQNIPHLFMALKPDCFMSKSEIEANLEQFITDFRAVKRMKDVDKLLLPGEIEYIRSVERREKGVPLTKALVQELNAFSAEINTEPLLAGV